MHGYDTYDYGARGYYPAMGRFTTVDPLAEDYYEISPYVYCLNNPIRNIDYMGLSAEDQVDRDKKDDPKKVDPKKVDPKKDDPKKVDPKKDDPKKDDENNDKNKKNKKNEASSDVIGTLSAFELLVEALKDLGVSVSAPFATIVSIPFIMTTDTNQDKFASEHTSNARPSTKQKHTDPRAGRATTKQRQKPGWKQTKDKKKEEKK